MRENWVIFSEKLKALRDHMSCVYFDIPVEQKFSEESLFKAFDGIDGCLKEADKHIMQLDEYNSKYSYGVGSMGPEDLRDDWPHAILVPEGDRHLINSPVAAL